jgi:hypothetical protein
VFNYFTHCPSDVFISTSQRQYSVKQVTTNVIAQHTSLTKQQVDPCDVENSLEDFSRQQHNFLRTANLFHVRGDDKYTRSVQFIVFMITGGRIPSISEMTTDEFGLRSKSDQWRILIRSIRECHLSLILRCGRRKDLYLRWTAAS